MIVTIHQPNYLPYLGFFHKMANADLFVVYDTALYSKQLGLHNRNRIKTPQGAQWLTVPVQHATLHALRDVQIVQGPWGTRHRLSLDANYKKAPFYASYAEEIRRVLEKPWTSLALLNEALIELVARWLSIPTKMIRASELPPRRPTRTRPRRTSIWSGPWAGTPTSPGSGAMIIWTNPNSRTSNSCTTSSSPPPTRSSSATLSPICPPSMRCSTVGSPSG